MKHLMSINLRSCDIRLFISIVFISWNLDFAIPVRILISLSVLASAVIICPRYLNSSICYYSSLFIVIFAFVLLFLDITIVLVFLTFMSRPDFWLLAFTLFVNACRSSVFSAIKTVSSAYLKLFMFLPLILIPCKYWLFLNISSVYMLNR